MQELEKENGVLRKYYELDEGTPDDEIKSRIFFDLELNRLKEENFKLMVMMKCQPTYIPAYYMQNPLLRS